MSEVVVAILMPEITDLRRFSIRYEGLENEVNQLGLTAVFAETHASYDPEVHGFHSIITTGNTKPAACAEPIGVVRDLTMPKSLDRPIYVDTQSPTLVHDPALNEYLKSKANLVADLPGIHPASIIANSDEIVDAVAATAGAKVVVKPVTGQLSKGVFVGSKNELPSKFDPGYYLVQEFIDTSRGIDELNIDGVHNLRMLSIGSQLVGAVARLQKEPGADLLQDDFYGDVYVPEQLPESMLAIADQVHSQLEMLPGEGRNITAIDTMRGLRADGEQVDVLCEVNRRPLRISRYDTINIRNKDTRGLIWLGHQWDVFEAQLLATVAIETPVQ